MKNLNPSLDNLKKDKKTEYKSLSWIESSPVCTKILDVNFNLKYMSRSGVEKLKIEDISEFYDKPYPLNFYADSFKRSMQNCLESAKKTNETVTHHASMPDNEGNELWFQSTIIPINNEHGDLDYFMVVSIETTEQKEAEKAILKNKTFNESLLKTSPDIIYVYDLIETKSVYNNNGNLKILGYSTQDIYDFGKDIIKSIMHPDDFKTYTNEILKKYQKANDGDIIELVFRVKHKEGQWRWLHSRESIFKRDKNNNPTQIIGIACDITEQKKAQQALEVIQQKLQNTFNLSPSIIATVDANKNMFIDANTAVTRILGYTIEEFTSKPFYEFIHPDDLKRTSKNVEDKLKGYNYEVFENRYLCKNGEYKWIAWQGTKPNNDGIVSAIGTDVTDRKKIENELRKSADRFERWKSSNFIGIIQSNSKGDILYANDAILKMLGFSKKEMNEGKLDWKKLTPPEYTQLGIQAIEEARLTGQWTPFEKEYYHKNGHRVPVLIGGAALNENRDEYIVFTIDLTETKKIEKSLRENKEFLSVTEEIAKVGGWELDLINNNLKWSEGTKSVHEVGQDYIPNLETAINFYHPDDREMVKTHVNTIIENGEQYSFEARIITAKGNQKYVKSIGQAVHKDGKCIRLFGAFQDITERKKIELELEKYRKELEIENVLLRKEMSLSFNYENMVYSSSNMSQVLTQVELVAQTDATVLILGETGTGKELIARAIHNTSKRKNNSLIRVNCATIPSELMESELFGHVKGSFTGAIDNRIGKFELAHGGTLFLDEIGELPISLQPKLLRAIQEGEIEPIGSSQLKKLDVRIIAATNKNLKKEIAEKRFREDLYFRLNVFPIKVPPLKDRVEDIPVLIEHFVNKYCKKHGKQIKYISDSTLSKMRNYSWPGNIRELENLIERAIIISNQDLLVIQEFDDPLNSKTTTIKGQTMTLAEVQRNHIIKILNQTNWKISGDNGAASLLDLKPSTLRDRMKKLGIRKI